MMLTILSRTVQPNVIQTNEELLPNYENSLYLWERKILINETWNVIKGDMAEYRGVWYL